ncbi:MAG: imelysin family protein [Polyangiales bacterium]
MDATLSRRRALAALALVPLAAACSETPADTFDRNAMLAAIADNVCVPLARATADAQRALATAAAAFADAPSAATLTAVRTSWRDARRPLKRALAFSAGPAETTRLRSAVDWPGDAAAVERALTASDPISDAAVDTLGANQRGMPAAEYLLFAGDEAATLAAFTTGPTATRRRDLLRAITAYGATRSAAYAAAWDRAMGDYAGQLARAGRGSTEFTTTRAAVDLVVNQLVAAVDSAASMRLGVPLGASEGGAPQPDRVESPYSDASLTDLRALLEGADAIYTGALDGRMGLGVRDLVRSRSAAVDAVVRTRTDAALAAVAAIPGTLREAVTRDPARVQAALDAVRAWKRTLQVDVANLLGVTVTFTDADGD